MIEFKFNKIFNRANFLYRIHRLSEKETVKPFIMMRGLNLEIDFKGNKKFEKLIKEMYDEVF